MHSRKALGIAALVAITAAPIAVSPVMAQEICINMPPTSLVDSSTEDEDAMQRIEALGNRCVYSRRTGERITPSTIQDFLQENPDQSDFVYGGLVTTE